MTTPNWIHKVEIDYWLDSGHVQTLYAEVERELHEQLLAAFLEYAENVMVTVYARLSPDSDLAPRVLRGSRIVRVEPLPDPAPVKPADISHRVQLAQGTLSSGAGIALGMWSGQGDWAAKLRPEGRADAGRRALAYLDQVLAELTAAREALATALDTTTSKEQ